jgi:hypothetical protein
VICTPCASKREDCRLLNSFRGFALCRHPTGICRAIGSEHFGACNARNPAGLAVMCVLCGEALTSSHNFDSHCCFLDAIHLIRQLVVIVKNSKSL